MYVCGIGFTISPAMSAYLTGTSGDAEEMDHRGFAKDYIKRIISKLSADSDQEEYPSVY
jgi:hypothetical protein